MTDVPELAHTAHDTKAVVIGGGLAGLVAAYRFAQVGMRVSVIEAQDAVGGALRTVTLGGQVADLVDSSFTAKTDFMDLLRELGLGADTIEQATVSRSTTSTSGVLPLPAGVAGIPANPFDPQVVALTGWGGAWRAYADRLRPVLTIGHQENLGKLVRSRMGKKVIEHITGPVARGTFGIGVDDVDVDVVAPTLNAALTRMGSLTGAVTAVLSEKTHTPRLMRDGIAALTDALAQRITDLDGAIVTDTHAEAISRDGAGFTITAAQEGEDGETSVTFDANLVVVATDETTARSLLDALGAPVAGDTLSRPAIAVTVAVKAAGLPDIGAGVFTALDEPAVWSIDDLSVQRALAADTRVLRVRLSPVAADRSDDELVHIATSEASRLLQARLIVTESAVSRTSAPAPASRLGHEQRHEQIQDAAEPITGLGIVGGWVAGGDIPGVVADATQTAETLRRGALFG